MPTPSLKPGKGRKRKKDRPGLGRVGTARRERGSGGVGRGQADQRRKGTIAGPTKARIRFGGTKILITASF
ncbi:hypothetical protein BY996DRAFT_6499065 [Phakopsora pachyrhizi]|nr:hypothetical protein BY996DRAFT_6499065 [Phakopsora pachyrhizi]